MVPRCHIGIGKMSTSKMSSLTSLECLFPKDMFGAIIGEKGARIKEIKDNNGVRISNDRDIVRTNMRRIVIDGEWAQIWHAFCEIIRTVADDERFKDRLAAAAKEDGDENKECKFAVEIKIPIIIAGSLIGKKGDNLNEWRKKWSDCSFDVDNDSNDDVFRYFRMHGVPQDMLQAVPTIAEVLENSLQIVIRKAGGQMPSLNRGGGGQRGGQQQRGGQGQGGNNTGKRGRADENMMDHQSYMGGNGNLDGVLNPFGGLNSIGALPGANAGQNYPNIGAPPGINPMMGGQGVQQLGGDNKRRRVESGPIPGAAAQGGLTPVAGIECTCTVNVEEQTIGKIIGSGGNVIKAIRQASACTITTDKSGDRPDGKREVQVRGVVPNVLVALQMIQTILLGGMHVP
ncbi:unnamed protein product [Amoebophrya sp. A25]|nr:unnamed protein product [Amoebophrya sp. A25]|eukprot:GSA25T00020669001.1